MTMMVMVVVLKVILVIIDHVTRGFLLRYFDNNKHVDHLA